MKETQSDSEAVNNNNNNNNDNNNRSLGAYPGLLTPGQLFPALMSPLALHASSLFHHSLWTPPTPNMQVKTTSSTSSRGKSTNKHKKVEVEEHTGAPLSPPTSGSSPQSTTSSGQEVSTKDSREKVFTCGICNRSFGYKHVLQNHERTHTGEKPFECKQCHKRFTRDHHLKTHMRLHTGEKPYHCTHCDRHFVQVANLRRHLRVHTGERPYACELCSSRFSDSNQLKAHMLIHKGEKPFQCNKCMGRFRRRHHLMHHKCHGKDDSDKLHDSENSMDPASPTMIVPKSYKSEEDEDELERGDILMEHHNINIVDDEENYADMEMDLNEEEIHYENNHLNFSRERKQRERKSRDIRRVVRFPNPITQMPTLLPEQTEPEDLSLSRRDDSSRVDEPKIIRRDNTPHRVNDPGLTWPPRHPKFRRHVSPPMS